MIVSKYKKAYLIKIFLISILFFVILQIYSNYSSVDSTLFKLDSNKKQSATTISSKPNVNFEMKFSNDYILNISSTRLNKLFDILNQKENEKNNYLLQNKLGLISFKDLISSKADLSANYFSNEIKNYLKVVDDRVMVNDNFIEYLYDISNHFSIQNPRNTVNRAQFSEVFIFTYILL
jgi:hypothetical protein